MNDSTLIFTNFPKVTFATNTFVNVPIILKHNDTNLIEIIKENETEFTTQIPIYHSDGTYLAKVKGNRIFATEQGKLAGLKLEKHPGLTVCTLAGQTLFEIQTQTGESFKAAAELYTPNGYFIKSTDDYPLRLFDKNKNAVTLNGVLFEGNFLAGAKIGIWIENNNVHFGSNG